MVASSLSFIIEISICRISGEFGLIVFSSFINDKRAFCLKVLVMVLLGYLETQSWISARIKCGYIVDKRGKGKAVFKVGSNTICNIVGKTFSSRKKKHEILIEIIL